MRRVRWQANAKDMFAYLRFIAPSGETGITGGATSLLTTRRYLYGYQPEGVNLELAKDNVVDDHYAFSPGQCVAGCVFFNGPGSKGVLDTPGWTPLMTNMLVDVTVEDLQGPAVANATTWGTWITGNVAPIEWDTSDNAYRRGSTGARVTGGGTVDLGSTPDDDAIMYWPQSRERIRGAEQRRAVYAGFETLPTITPRRLLVEGDLCVAEAKLDYDGTTYDCVFIFELRDGRIAKETAYWSQPFEAPAWRADFVERM